MRDEPCAREVDETNVMRRVAIHEVDDQMVNRRIFLVVFLIRDPMSGEDGDAEPRVFLVERAFPAANEEFRVDLADLLREEFVQEIDARLSTVESAASGAEKASVARVLRGFEEGRAPHRLPFEFQKFIFLVRDRVADRICSDIKSEIIIFGILGIFHVDIPLFGVKLTNEITLLVQIKNSY